MAFLAHSLKKQMRRLLDKYWELLEQQAEFQIKRRELWKETTSIHTSISMNIPISMQKRSMFIIMTMSMSIPMCMVQLGMSIPLESILAVNINTTIQVSKRIPTTISIDVDI